MLNDWIKVILYVTVNTPVPTHKELWKPATPHSAHLTPAKLQGAPTGLDVSGSPGQSGAEFHGEKQTLINPMDVGATRTHGPGWVDLNRPSQPESVAHTVGSPDRERPAEHLEKQELKAAPKHVMQDDKGLHAYRFRMSGHVSSEGHPATGATVVLKVATSNANVVRKVVSGPDGAYALELTIRGADSENALWWIHAETRDGRSPDQEGGRIFAVQEPSMSMERDLVLAPVQSPN